jgi:hypothetical protein
VLRWENYERDSELGMAHPIRITISHGLVSIIRMGEQRVAYNLDQMQIVQIQPPSPDACIFSQLLYRRPAAMRKHGVPRTMIRATRYGSGSTRLKPSSCASTAGSPSMTANPWFECVQELTSKESRALSQTANSQNTFNGAFVVNTNPCGC